MLTATAYDTHVEQLFSRIRQLHSLLTAIGVPYRLVGGVAVFIHVSERDPLRARATADVDAAIDRKHLQTVIDAASQAGWTYRRAVGVDMLVDAAEPRARSAIHLVFLNEKRTSRRMRRPTEEELGGLGRSRRVCCARVPQKVRPEYVEAVPASPPSKTREGILLASVADLVHMKLTSYRLKDRVHIQDLDAVGLISPELESELSGILKARLAEVRASE